jgi:PleD family two-component response regulator
MKYQVAFSLGYSHLTAQDTPASLMIRADKKLYQDKFSTPHSVENIA